MGSAKDESQQEEALSTPEALRSNIPSPKEVRPGEASVTNEGSRRSTAPPSSEKRSKWRSCAGHMRFVPWWSLLAVALLVVGIVGFALKAKDVGDLSKELFNAIGSDNTRFPKFISIFTTCYPVTLGVAGGVVAVSLLMASIRTNQKLRRLGNTKTTGAYGPLTFRILHWMCCILLAFVCLCCAWFLINLLLVTSWGLGLSAVHDGSTVAAQTMSKVAAWSGLYTAQLEEMRTTVATSNMNDTLGDDLAIMATFAPALVPTGQASVLNDSLVPAEDSVCPSVGCLNLALYNFLESSNCACTTALLTTINTLTDDALKCIIYTIVALGCMVVGCILACMQLATGVNLMATDQLLLKVVRRRPSSVSSMHRVGEGTPPISRDQFIAGQTFSEKKLLQHNQMLSSVPQSAARRLPYSTPPCYNVHSDGRSP